jgi:hypothetical protein
MKVTYRREDRGSKEMLHPPQADQTPLLLHADRDILVQYIEGRKEAKGDP